ncbi:hypothetical protein SK854_23040 [Lentzea sp. BCCO 10_0061]|uniref:AbiTii domain-containing protein n=1 Tax=Lentzea sokolovensis TaxID=3095429 RepID=A0ABU4UZV4_9PSEU|nr:hypothetical protein [Lentzea sp. BCCO 10_0061]MDX8145004.1 hypothetical protein [Lentzea sp. BCCO 10_0061]
MSPASDVRQLLRVALDEFDRPGNTVSASARRAVRIAALRRDHGNQLWLQWELTDLKAGRIQKRQDPAISWVMAQLDALLGAEEGGRERRRAFLMFERNRTFLVDGEEKFQGDSLGQIEQRLAMSRRAYDDLTVPSNLTAGDMYFVAKDVDSARAKIIPVIQQQEQLMERIKSAIHSFLVTTESELDQGQQDAPLFLRAQEYINTALAKYAPLALEKFVAAQERLYSGKSEDLAHALTSCRRMTKALADALYPSTDEGVTGSDGIERKMTDDAYRNRLLQYVREQLGKRTHGSVIQKTLDSLGARLKSLDSLASKGVHDEVTAAEAETCIVWTYLLAADVVRIADGSSALLLPQDGDRETTKTEV